MNEKTKLQVVCDNAYRYRWAIAGILFLICVVFALNGSSIGIYSSYLGSDIEQNLLGVSRPIRSDEWCVFTPFSFAQTAGGYNYINQNIAGGTDMFIVYGQPVWTWAMIFRPFQIGYLFLGAARGLSFFWAGRFFALFMVSFEFGMLLTKGSKKLALALACLVALSPLVAWWFSVNGICELLICGQLAILIAVKFLRAKKLLHRCLLALGLSICAGTYILVFYPAWQVSLFYVFLSLAIGVIAKEIKRAKEEGRRLFKIADLVPLGIFIALLGAGLGYVFLKSHETISLVTNTAYPGARIETGGGYFAIVFQYIHSLFLPYVDYYQSGIAEFFSFFPLGIVLAAVVMLQRKKVDAILVSLLGVTAFLFVFLVFGFPMFLSKLTLMSAVPVHRAKTAFELANIILLVRALSLSELRFSIKKLRSFVPAAAFCAIAAAGLAFFAHESFEFIDKWFTLIAFFVLLAVFSLSLLVKNKRAAAGLCGVIIAISLAAGGAANPIGSGTKGLLGQPIVSQIQQIDESESGLWATAMSMPYINIPLAAGVRTLNATYTYPHFDVFDKVDPERKYEEIYNRYAHFVISIQNELDTHFILNYSDAFTLRLNSEDIHKLGINYLIADRDLSEYNSENLVFEELVQENIYFIYKIHYTL